MQVLVPEDLQSVYESALQLYPHFAAESAEKHIPFGYQVSEQGLWVCDSHRLHAIGELPDTYWSRLLWPTNRTYLAWLDSAELRTACEQARNGRVEIRNEYPEAGGISADELPHGFCLSSAYLIDALDFLLGLEDGKVSIWYAQGVFTLFREEESDEFDEEGNIVQQGQVRFGRRCHIAGFLGNQWTLPFDRNEVLRATLIANGLSPECFVNELPSLTNSQLTFEDRVATKYPMPLAWSYYQSSVASSSMAEYRGLLRAGENLLAFLGALSLALVLPEDRVSLGLDARRLWGNGVSPGHWQLVIQKTSAVLQRYDSGLAKSVAQSVRSRTSKGGIGELLTSMVSTKNDFKHDRAVGTEEAATAEIPKLRAKIMEVYERLEYLCEYPLHFVRDMDFDAERGTFCLGSLSYMGALPIPRQERLEWYQPVGKNRLYVQDSAMSLTALEPFVRRELCSQCGEIELFFVEKLPGGNKVTLRSFERGHTLEVLDSAVRVEEWFMA